MLGEIETQDRNPAMPALDKAWSLEIQETVQKLKTDAGKGLNQAAAQQLLKNYGPNVLTVRARRPAWRIFISQFANLIIALLAIAGVLSLIFEQPTEAAAIAAAILVNALIGFFTELKASRSMESLRKMAAISTKVVRDGKLLKTAASKLVPGDLVELGAGDLVPADMRLIEANRLQVDESALTGESLPVGKAIKPVSEDAPLAERRSMLFKSTALNAGSAKGVVTATGHATELGRISRLTEEAASTEDSPLQQRLNRLGQRLVWITIAVTLVLGVAGWLSDRPWLLIVEMAVALAVAAIPEGLPIVATIALARGMWRMAQRHALITRLSAVETLGSTTIICTDKTGTLTVNQMELTEIILPSNTGLKKLAIPDQLESSEDEGLRPALEAGVLCSNAELDQKEETLGDPLEGALLRAGRRLGLERENLLAQMPEEREEAFDPEIKMMATFHVQKEGYLVAVKGAPEAVLAACRWHGGLAENRELDHDILRRWQQANQEMAAKGLRVIALAQGKADSLDHDPYKNLSLLALAGLWDPPDKARLKRWRTVMTRASGW
jgi:Ca2+-transporting ATPase